MTEYPKIEQMAHGFIVQINKRVTLPGHFTSYILAQKALRRYQGAQAQAKSGK
jgi:hypothetical protein